MNAAAINNGELQFLIEGRGRDGLPLGSGVHGSARHDHSPSRRAPNAALIARNNERHYRPASVPGQSMPCGKSRERLVSALNRSPLHTTSGEISPLAVTPLLVAPDSLRQMRGNLIHVEHESWPREAHWSAGSQSLSRLCVVKLSKSRQLDQ